MPWLIFIGAVLILLALDLGVFNRRPHVVGTRESLLWTGFWIALALAFNVLIYLAYDAHWLGLGQSVDYPLDGERAATEFLTGYLIEKSLSIDNIFVIALILGHFRVPAKHQHRMLFWGIIGALVMRGVMIGAGAVLLETFSFTVYIFGALLLYTAAHMMLSTPGDYDPNKSILLRLARRIYPVHEGFDEGRFFVVRDGKRAMTMLLLALCSVEAADVVFAIDSIPAIFSITRDPFIVFTSNIFAIMGLRSLYFALAATLDKFRYVQNSLTFMLAFIGAKMILSHHYEIPAWVSLVVIASILSVGIAASVIANRRGSDSAAI